MKGYPTDTGYKGYVPNEGYILFATEEDYKEYYNANFIDTETK